MAYPCKLTVFTPTYNRAYIIENLYRSLQKQTCTDFEWLVVDDGSSDDTGALFERWQQEDNPFPIRYHRQENGGKCRAINTGLNLARGELFLNVDSDDFLTEDAVEKVLSWEANLPKDGTFCAVAGNLGTGREETPNPPLPGDYYDGNAFDRYGVVKGERAFAFYTAVHRQYLYPDCPGEKFMTEAVTWNRMAKDGYKIRFYNDIIWIYEYKPDGLTQAGDRLFWENPQGTGIFFREKAKFLKQPFSNRVKMWYGFVTDTMHRCTNSQIAEYIDMPLWLVPLMKGIHNTLHLLRKKR
jgi:glycosyltransferase involved in cell wall biosynthesis